MSVISLVQSHYHKGSPVGKRSLRLEGFVEKVGFDIRSYLLHATTSAVRMRADWYSYGRIPLDDSAVYK